MILEKNLFFSHTNYKQTGLFFNFKKKKFERLYIKEKHFENFLYRNILALFFLLTAFIEFIPFSLDISKSRLYPNNILILVSSICIIMLKYKRDNYIPIRILFELIYMLFSYKISLIFINSTYILVDLIVHILICIVFPNINVNIIIVIIGWFINYLINIELSYNLLVMIIIIFLYDFNLRKKWIELDSYRKSYNLAISVLEKLSSPIYLFNNQKQIIYFNESGKQIYEKQTKNNNKKMSFNNLFEINDDLAIFESKISDLKLGNEFLPFQLSFYVGKSENDNNKSFIEPNKSLNKILEPNKSLNISTLEKDNSTNLNSPNISQENENKKRNYFIPIKIENIEKKIDPRLSFLNLLDSDPFFDTTNNNGIRFDFIPDRKQIKESFDLKLSNFGLDFLVEGKNNSERLLILGRMKVSYQILSEKMGNLLDLVENDYIKWNNLQNIYNIKESDLKNLGLCVYDLNQLINIMDIKKEKCLLFLKYNENLEIKFHIQNTLIYLMELMSVKTIEKQIEINLKFEESFPDFVVGDFVLFKQSIFIILKIILLKSNMPKHSKFEFFCKLKELIRDSSCYILNFTFEFPRIQSIVTAFQTLFNDKDFKATDFLRNTILIQDNMDNSLNKEEIIMIRPILDRLSAKAYISDKDSTKFILNIDIPFNFVELSSLAIGPNSKSIRVIPKLMNLSFSKVLIKKNFYSWKAKIPIIFKSNKNDPKTKFANIKQIKSEFKVEDQEKKEENKIDNTLAIGKRRESVLVPINNFKNESSMDDLKILEEIDENKKNDQKKSHFKSENQKSNSKLNEIENHETKIIKIRPCIQKIIRNRKKILKNQLKKDVLTLIKDIFINPIINNKMSSENFLIQKKSSHKVDFDLENDKYRYKYNTFSSITELNHFNYEEYIEYLKKKYGSNILPSKILKSTEKIFYLKNRNSEKNLKKKNHRTTSLEKSPYYSNHYYENQNMLFVLPVFSNETNELFSYQNPENKYEKEYIVPYLNKIEENNLPEFIWLRLQTRRSQWFTNLQSSKTLIFIKRNRRNNNSFFILVNDDSLNTLFVIQKFPFNSLIEFEMSKNGKEGIEIFRKKIENGYLYDLILIDGDSEPMFGIILAKNIRDTEKIIKYKLFICVIFNHFSNNLKEIWKDIEIDKVLIRPINQNMISELIEEIKKGK